MEQYGKATYNFAYRLTGNEADARDLTQEAFIRVYRAWRSFQPGTSFLSWIYRIVTNLHRDELRRQKGRFQEEIPEDNAPQEYGGSKPLAVDPVEDYMAEQLGGPLAKVARSTLHRAASSHCPRRHRGIQLPRDCRYHGVLDRNGSVAATSRAGSPSTTRDSGIATRNRTMNHYTDDDLIDYLHGEVSDELDVRIHAHLAQCSDCSERYDAEAAVGELLRASASPRNRPFRP